MADSQRSVVSIVAIFAIVILVGLVVYFVMDETDDAIEIDFNLDGSRDAPAQVAELQGVPSGGFILSGPGENLLTT